MIVPPESGWRRLTSIHVYEVQALQAPSQELKFLDSRLHGLLAAQFEAATSL